MPLFEYHCNQCHQTFEKLVSFSEIDAPIVCPSCGSQDTKKAITAFASKTSSATSSSSQGSCNSGGKFR